MNKIRVHELESRLDFMSWFLGEIDPKSFVSEVKIQMQGEISLLTNATLESKKIAY